MDTPHYERTPDDIINDVVAAVKHLADLMNEARIRGIEVEFSINREERKPYVPRLFVRKSLL